MNRTMFIFAFVSVLASAVRLNKAKSRDRKSNALSTGPYEKEFKAKFPNFNDLPCVGSIKRNNTYKEEINKARVKLIQERNAAIKERNAAKEDPAEHETLESLDPADLKQMRSLRVGAGDLAEDFETFVPEEVVLQKAGVSQTNLKLKKYHAYNYVDIGGNISPGVLTKSGASAIRAHIKSLFGEDTYDIGEEQWAKVLESDLAPVFDKMISGAANQIQAEERIKQREIQRKCRLCNTLDCNGVGIASNNKPFRCINSNNKCATCGSGGLDCCSECTPRTRGCK